MKTDRLVGIIMTLLHKKRMSAQELADLFEVSCRTIYRDLDAIGLAGIPIRSMPGVGGGFEIMPEYRLDKTVFSAAELSAILLGLSNLSGVLEGGELTNALAKIKSLIPAEHAKEIEIQSGQLCIDFSAWSGSRNLQPYIKIMKAAFREHRLLSFEYIAHRGKITARTVEPYQLVLKSSHWYLYGYCRRRNDYRLFRLSRMSNLQLNPETFVPRNPPRPVLDFDAVMQTMQTEIKLRIHSSILDRVLEYCTYDRFTPDGEAHYIVNFPFIENAYSYDILLGFGAQCECLEPPHIRAKLAQKILAMADIYHDPHP